MADRPRGASARDPIDTALRHCHVAEVRAARDQHPYNVRYYARNRERELDRVVRRQRATIEFLRTLRQVPCLDCKRMFLPHQMDFDHRDPASKDFGITWSQAMLAPRSRLLQELAKCDVVCANCHASRTYALQARHRAERLAAGMLVSTPRRIRQRTTEAKRRAMLLALRDRACLDCLDRFPPHIMQFDHRDPTAKKFNVSQTWLAAESRILNEAAKCDIVCPNCHRDRTLRQRHAVAGVAQPGRAAAFQAVGRGSESRLPLR